MSDLALEPTQLSEGSAAVAIPAQTVDPVVQYTLLQAIRCGTNRVAVSYQWAHAIVDRFEIVPVPKAPVWLMGATVIDAQVLPVIDLALYVDPTFRRPAVQKDVRLLVGGSEDGALLDPPLALVFDGLPQQVRSSANELQHATALVPEQLANVVDGSATSTQGEQFHIINIQRLANDLAAELSVL
jgi:chemotaxis signal transduction protein